jgi:hypothetical protein
MFYVPSPDESLRRLLTLKKLTVGQQKLSVSQYARLNAAQTEYGKRNQAGSKLMPAAVDPNASKSKGYWFDRR